MLHKKDLICAHDLATFWECGLQMQPRRRARSATCLSCGWLRIYTNWWTAKGNLVLFACHSISQEQLTNAVPLITSLYMDIYSIIITNPDDIQARANVKWSKILIHSIPTGVSNDRGPWTPDECHQASGR